VTRGLFLDEALLLGEADFVQVVFDFVVDDQGMAVQHGDFALSLAPEAVLLVLVFLL
jgi:hypothetical protein